MGVNSSHAALAAGATFPPYSTLFSGSSIDSNSFFTSSRATFDIGIAVGTYDWTTADPNLQCYGLSTASNSVPAGVVERGQYFMAVTGMKNVVSLNNTDNGGFRYVNTLPLDGPAHGQTDPDPGGWPNVTAYGSCHYGRLGQFHK
jgi:hypothetical protein